jgi:hypothetical protein
VHRDLLDEGARAFEIEFNFGMHGQCVVSVEPDGPAEPNK